MGRRAKRPGWFMLVNPGGRFIAVSVSVLTPFLIYLFVLVLWLSRTSSDWTRLPASWIVFMLVSAFGIPVAISVATGLLDATIARSRGRQVRGLVFVGTTLAADVRVSPSRPAVWAESRPHLLMRTALLIVIAVPALVVMNAQLGLDGDGPFRAYWIGRLAAGWSAIALPATVLQLLTSYLVPAPTPQLRARWLSKVALASLCLPSEWAVMIVFWHEGWPFEEAIAETMSPAVMAGVMYAAAGEWSGRFAHRAISRDLRHVAVGAIAVDGASLASEVLSQHQSPGFLVTDQGGQLVGWLSRDDALGSPGSLMSGLARPLIDPVPIKAEQRGAELCRALDPYFDGRDVVAIAHEGVLVGYIVIAKAFEYVTGDSAWTRILDSD